MEVEKREASRDVTSAPPCARRPAHGGSLHLLEEHLPWVDDAHQLGGECGAGTSRRVPRELWRIVSGEHAHLVRKRDRLRQENGVRGRRSEKSMVKGGGAKASPLAGPVQFSIHSSPASPFVYERG